MRNSEMLEKMIKEGQFEKAIELAKKAKDYGEGESFAFIVLRNENLPTELIDAAFETFLSKRENRYREHGYWVHSLSHFTRELWQRRMDSWIKKFYEAAFKGANELDDPNCCDRLVDHFVDFAKWNDDPKDFGITHESLAWMKSNSTKERIEAMPFASEEASIQAILKLVPTHWDGDAQEYLLDIRAIDSYIKRLGKLGSDTTEFEDLRKDLLEKQLKKIEQIIAEIDPVKDSDNWRRNQKTKGLETTKKALGLI